MIKEVEDIILKKHYFELSPTELEVVSEYAQNEEEYEDMKFFLLSAGEVFANDKIEPSADLKKNVFAHLHESGPSKRIWLNSVGAFLFPTEKKMYQYPGLQIAAVAVIAFGLTFLMPTNSDLNSVAQNNVIETSDQDDLSKNNDIQNEDLSGETTNAEGDVLKEAELTNSRSLEDGNAELLMPQEETIELNELEEVMDEEIADSWAKSSGSGSNDNGVEVDIANSQTTTLTDRDNKVISGETIDYRSEQPATVDQTTLGGVNSKNELARNKDRNDNKGLKKSKESQDAPIETNAYFSEVNDSIYVATGSVDTAPATEEKVYTTSEAGGKFDDGDSEAYKTIRPTSYHIEGSKELKSLFSTVK